MSIGLGDIDLVNIFAYVAVWFGLIDKIKTANRTKPCV